MSSSPKEDPRSSPKKSDLCCWVSKIIKSYTMQEVDTALTWKCLLTHLRLQNLREKNNMFVRIWKVLPETYSRSPHDVFIPRELFPFVLRLVPESGLALPYGCPWGARGCLEPVALASKDKDIFGILRDKSKFYICTFTLNQTCPLGVVQDPVCTWVCMHMGVCVCVHWVSESMFAYWKQKWWRWGHLPWCHLGWGYKYCVYYCSLRKVCCPFKKLTSLKKIF